MTVHQNWFDELFILTKNCLNGLQFIKKFPFYQNLFVFHRFINIISNKINKKQKKKH